MEQVGIRELEQNAGAVIARVKSGKTVEVTERGKPVALLTPRADTRSAFERLVDQGEVELATGIILDVEPLDLGPGNPATRALMEMRDEDTR